MRDPKLTFLIRCSYGAVWLALIWLMVRYVLVWLLPFLIALALAALLEPAVVLCRRRLHLRRGFTATVLSLVVLGTVAAGLVLLGIGCGFAGGILRALNTKPELMDGAVLYLRIYCLGMPALAVYNFGNAVFSAVGDTRRPLYYLSIAGVINVVLNLFFVIVCNMDVAGVAVASIISQYFSAILVTAALLRSRESYCLRFSQLRFHKTRTKAILSIGIPSGLQNAIFALANLFIQRGVNTFSATMVAGNSAATNADALVYDVMQAFYTACGSFIGQNYGAGKKDRIRRTFLISTAYAFGAGLLLGLGLLLFGRPFLSLFTTDPQVMDAGMYRLTVMSVSYCVSAFMDGAIAASRGLGKSAVPMVIVILGSCVFRIIWVYTVFAWFGTITSLYLLYVFSWTITAAAEIIYFIRIYRQATADLTAA